MIRVLTLATVFLLVMLAQAEGRNCPGLSKLRQSLAAANIPRGAALAADPPSNAVQCSSIASVVSLILKRDTAGGRRLERDQPVSTARAQADLEAAYRDAEVRSLLEQVARETPDAAMRLLYEAAILDDGGYYAARDAKIEQLRKQLE